MSSDFMNDEDDEIDISSLYGIDWDLIEEMIEDELLKHMRTFEHFTYFIVDDKHVLVKIFDISRDVPAFMVKMRLYNNRLIVENVE